MDKQEWKKEPPESAGFWWMLYTNQPGPEKPVIAMIIQYPDEMRMQFIGDSKLYLVNESAAENLLWAGPITYPMLSPVTPPKE